MTACLRSICGARDQPAWIGAAAAVVSGRHCRSSRHPSAVSLIVLLYCMSMFLDAYAGCVELRPKVRVPNTGEHLQPKSMQICYGGRTVDVQPSIHLKPEMYERV